MRGVKRSRNDNEKTKAQIPYITATDQPVIPSVMDLLCDSSPLQWWYLNAHLRDRKGEKEFSFFASFFRQKRGFDSYKDQEYSSACTWALIDVGEEKYYADSLLDHKATSIIAERLEVSSNSGSDINHSESVILEMAKKGHLPRPDRAMKRAAVYNKSRLEINYDDECRITGEGDGDKRRYTVHHHNPLRGITVDLEFSARTGPVLHGNDGIVNNMFYYYYPSMEVKGRIQIGDLITYVEGDGWYDREYGGSEDETGRDALDSWTWFSLRLSNGSQLSIFDIVDAVTGKKKEILAVLTSDNGERRLCHDITVNESDWWTSLVTFLEYPLKYHIEVPSLGVSLDVRAAFSHQEFVTVVVSGGFYEGRVNGDGKCNGSPVNVIGFCEQKCFNSKGDISKLLKNVGRFVGKTLSNIYPLETTDEWIAQNVLGRYCTHKGVVSRDVCDTLFRPIRSIIDRGGKAWRSLVLVSSCNALSRDYFDCTRYIAIAELLHVGSLVIDDIEDESTIRRGGRTAHIDFGVPIAINAGTACYFMAVSLAEVHLLPVEKANRVYELYFDVMKAGHAGQGLDIRGLGSLMPDVVRTGNSIPLHDALQAIHTYKTGAVAGAICHVACILCDANKEVTSAMESFGLSLGLAFQIVDDALNVKGFEGDLKEAGEDIRDGKITYPVAKAMGRLTLSQRERIWEILQEHTSDCGKIKEVVDLLNSVNAIDDCLEEARNIVDEKWEVLDPLLEDSLPKVMMRTFCAFLTNRAY
ncbi:polyprenyl synthase [Trypanosoma grayi]|uniref:polyprenyl synthase n=1 Tax=Trypanosoma grayi TaxID=71804 RepID=UPI0004F42956|nr:polyprenyl synthase [Trypanosoma grayi]KEG06817.1 polyprenyl synthase [Trypanosoma grayi]